MTYKGDFQHLVEVARECGLDIALCLKPAIDMIAEDFRCNLKAEGSAPRIGDVLARLRDIADASNTLHRKLASLDLYTHSALAGGWPFPGVDCSLNSDDVIASLSLVEIAPEHPDRLNSGLLRSLRELKELASRRATEIEEEWSIRFEDGRPDHGSVGDLHRMRLPTAKRALARDCWVLAAETLDIRPTSTTGGPFYRLVAAIYEYATGGEADGPGVGLARYVKDVVGAARDVNQYFRKLQLVENMMQRRRELSRRRERLSRIHQRLQTLMVLANQRFRGFPPS